MGAELKEFYMVMGQYNAVWIVEAPDDETVAKLCLTIAARGNARTQTPRAWPHAEYKRICAALPEQKPQSTVVTSMTVNRIIAFRKTQRLFGNYGRMTTSCAS